jgi:hypothetical protein
MKISLKKVDLEKFEITITDGDNVLFNTGRYYHYMGEDMVTPESINETITQLSQIFGNFTEIENDFDI